METPKSLNPVPIARSARPVPSFTAILDLIAALRAENGCPWDRAQTPHSMTVYLIEETYELVEAILADDDAAIQEELGDVLFQVLFAISLFQQEGRLKLSDVLAQNLAKMIRRHPHVFGNDKVETASQVKRRWKEIKAQEKSEKKEASDQGKIGSGQDSLLDSVPSGMPGLLRSFRISERAAGVGFDWDHLSEVIDQVELEWAEFKAELHLKHTESKIDADKAAMEFGDVLFSMVNVARVAGIHPETALGRSTQKFIERFKIMEAMAVDRNLRLEELSREKWEDFWLAAKNY